jgi:hypothetical protein
MNLDEREKYGRDEPNFQDESQDTNRRFNDQQNSLENDDDLEDDDLNEDDLNNDNFDDDDDDDFDEDSNTDEDDFDDVDDDDLEEDGDLDDDDEEEDESTRNGDLYKDIDLSLLDNVNPKRQKSVW